MSTAGKALPHRRGVRLLPQTILILLVFFPAAALAVDLTTVIDLNYTYEQEHLGSSVTEDTTIQQKYEINYEATLTPIYDLLASVKLDLEDTSGDFEADTSKIAPSLEIQLNGTQAVMKFTYDATYTKTEEFEEESSSEVYANSYLAELETKPYYWPELRLKFERKRDYEEQSTETVTKTMEMNLRKEVGDFTLEFGMILDDTESILPVRENAKGTEWNAQAAYKSTLWRDVDVELTYEINEVYDETSRKGVFSEDEEEYIHQVQARFKKSLMLLPRLKVDLSYEYKFEQDLLLVEKDYLVEQDLQLKADWKLTSWFTAKADVKRQVEETVNVPPEGETEQRLNDVIELGFNADPVPWLRIAGKAKWNFEDVIEEGTGGSVDTNDGSKYELSVKNKWGRWWDLTATVGSEFEYTDDWLTKEKGKAKVQWKLTFFDNLNVETTYEVQRTAEYEEFSPLALDETREQDFKLKFDYRKDFSRYIRTSFIHEFGLSRDEELDEVLNYEDVLEFSEDTKIKVTLQDFMRDMKLDGEITRKASDTKDDEEPMLVDITYGLKWTWVITDLKLEASFKYDDNGDTFDDLTFNTKVAWQRENIDVSGEYQFDKTYSDETEEQRKLNLKMNIKF